MALRPFQAYLDDIATIRVEMKKEYDAQHMIFTLVSENKKTDLFVHQRIEEEEFVTYLLTCLHPLHLENTYLLYDQDHNYTEVGYGAIVRQDIFDDYFSYEKENLGASYSPSQTIFRIWAPISKVVYLILDEIPYPLQKGSKGVWEITISGDLDGKSYHYLHRANGQWLSVHDPYALSSLINSQDSVVINPQKLKQVSPLKQNIPFSQAIIYEMSVRDFSQQKEVGFQYPGTFRGITESPVIEGIQLGKHYLKNLGITHIQLMPVYDFGSVDEAEPKAVYNWGYDPVQYNVPEGSFSSDPNDPYARIIELQEAIQSYHDDGIGVLMDVVYNHVYHAETYAFEKIIPGYFYRYDHSNHRTNGTFCGNDVASERAMVRRYIKHSLKQWLQLYEFDGFRFDLMGILDLQTMQEITDELRHLAPDVYLYGEGWQMSTGYPTEQLAHQYNAAHIPEIGFFNDEYRNVLKETLLNPHILQSFDKKETIQDLLAASRYRHFSSPKQTLNYLECHDNATFFDYLHLQRPDLTSQEQERIASFGLQFLLLSQGIPFLHSGQEFFRTKENFDNTYNLPDAINRLDWQRALQHTKHIEYIQRLIAFRKKHPILSQSDYHLINETCDFYWFSDALLRYRLQSETETLTIFFNFSFAEAIFERPSGQHCCYSYPQVVDKSASSLCLPGYGICIFSSKI